MALANKLTLAWLQLGVCSVHGIDMQPRGVVTTLPGSTCMHIYVCSCTNMHFDLVTSAACIYNFVLINLCLVG